MRENKKRNYMDLISGIVIMVLAAFFFYTTFGTKSFLGTGRGRTAPDTIPKAVAIAMFVLGASGFSKLFGARFRPARRRMMRRTARA